MNKIDHYEEVHKHCAQGSEEQHVDDQTTGMSEAEICTNTLISAVKKATDSMAAMIEAVKATPTDIRQNSCFKIATDSARNLMGIPQPPDHKSYDAVAQMTKSMTAENWNDPGWIESIEKMMQVVHRKLDLANQANYPSFSLGVDLDSDEDIEQHVHEDVHTSDLFEEGNTSKKVAAEDTPATTGDEYIANIILNVASQVRKDNPSEDDDTEQSEDNTEVVVEKNVEKSQHKVAEQTTQNAEVAEKGEDDEQNTEDDSSSTETTDVDNEDAQVDETEHAVDESESYREKNILTVDNEDAQVHETEDDVDQSEKNYRGF